MQFRQAVQLSAAVFSGLAAAHTETVGVVQSTVDCHYNSGSGGVAPTPVPTIGVNGTTAFVLSTAPATTVPFTITEIDPETTVPSFITTTLFNVTTKIITAPTPSTSTIVLTETITTATVVETVCASGAAPATVTEYTGTYEPVSGQVTTLSATYPTQAMCTTAYTFTGSVFPTVTSGTTTVTMTFGSTPLGLPTSTVIITGINGFSTTYLSTVSTTLTSHAAAITTSTTTVDCGATVTKTMDAKCAPTNLINAINQEGLQTWKYASGAGETFFEADPSECCQACLDNEDCAGMMNVFGSCSLFYLAGDNGEATCDGTVFTYSSSNQIAAGQGIVVQNGCGNVGYAGSV